MSAASPQPPDTQTPVVPPAPIRYRGEVVYIYAFDLANEMRRGQLPSLLGQPITDFVVDAAKRAPKQVFFFRPQMVRLPPEERIGPFGPMRLSRTIKLLTVGAISITVRIPFDVASLEELVMFHDLRFSDGTFLYDDVQQLAEDARQELKPHLVDPVATLGQEEAYTVFCIESPLLSGNSPFDTAEQWLDANRRTIAQLLTEEPDPRQLSQQEAEESTGRYLSYYRSDVVVVDWDAALVVDEPRYFDESVYIMELANFQLAELEAYDRILDNAVERSYRDLSRGGRIGILRSSRVRRELREMRVDFARLSDELSNNTKFFGDWHAARLYQAISSRFHLADWHKTIDEKLKTMDDLYQLLQQDRNSLWMLFLEATIVLLFIIDIVALFVV